jgi:isochorismate pyruvate lyase
MGLSAPLIESSVYAQIGAENSGNDICCGAIPAALRPLDAKGCRAQVGFMKNLHRIEAPPRGARFEAPDPDACETMLDVRAGVDEIDRMLVALIARRQGYMDAAARIKPSRDVVRDEARIRQVLANVKAEAERQGLSWAIAEPVWRELMERCIAHEFEVWDATRV